MSRRGRLIAAIAIPLAYLGIGIVLVPVAHLAGEQMGALIAIVYTIGAIFGVMVTPSIMR